MQIKYKSYKYCDIIFYAYLDQFFYKNLQIKIYIKIFYIYN